MNNSRESRGRRGRADRCRDGGHTDAVPPVRTDHACDGSHAEVQDEIERRLSAEGTMDVQVQKVVGFSDHHECDDAVCDFIARE